MRMPGVSFALLFCFLFLQVNTRAQLIEGQRYLVSVKEAATPVDVLRDLETAGFRIVDSIEEIGAHLVEPARADSNPAALFRARSLAAVERDDFALAHAVSALPSPNDPLYSEQDWADRLELKRAWRLGTGSREVIVAIPDTGIKLDHPDLKNRLWRNTGEIANNGIDDDANGLVDDVHGWNFYGHNNRLSDDYGNKGHGTLVAGIIGAEPSNRRGISGINWNVRLMTLKTCGRNGKSSTLAQVQSIIYAVKQGARLINASWGTKRGSPHLNAIFQWAHARGALIVVGSGNDGDNLERDAYYPSSFRSDSLVSVASSNSPKKLSGFSNWGVTTVHLAAPGNNVLSTANTGSWETASGTSFAAPMVTGVAALLLAKAPTLTPTELRNAVLNAAEFRPAFLEKLATGGELNAYKALRQLDEGFQVWPSQLTLQAGDRFQLTAYRAHGAVQWAVSNTSVASIDDNGTLKAHASGVVEIVARDSAGQVARTRWLRVMPRTLPRKGS